MSGFGTIGHTRVGSSKTLMLNSLLNEYTKSEAFKSLTGCIDKIEQRKQRFRNLLSEIILSADSQQMKRLFRSLGTMNLGLAMEVELPFTGWCIDYLRKEGDRKSGFTYILSGKQAVVMMERCYKRRSMGSAQDMAGMKATTRNGWTWKNSDFQAVLVEFFILMASYVPRRMDNYKDLNADNIDRIESMAIEQICKELICCKSK
jgi:hypothetical protein